MNKQQRYRIAIGGLAFVTLAAMVARLSNSRAGDGPTQAPWARDYRSYVGNQSLGARATVRVFGTHPDFGRTIAGGPGAFVDIMANELNPSGLPSLLSTGHRVVDPALDAAGRPIIRPRPYIAVRSGDVAGRVDAGAAGAVESAASFAQWFTTTSGVNREVPASIELVRQGSLLTFEGTLDTLTGSTLTAYTAEAEYHFVYEAGRDYYIAAETNAEVWAFVDGKLVLDVSGVHGVSFDIVNGVVVPREPFAVTTTVLGSAIQQGNNPIPVTTMMRVGATGYQPFGSYASAATGNVNDNQNPRQALLGTTHIAGSGISVTGRSWLPKQGGFEEYLAIDSSSGSANVKVLRNGDLAPDIRPFQSQASLQSYLHDYIDTQTRRVVLHPNQAIFLFELGTTNLNSSAADFQDLVVLVSLDRPGGSGTGGTTTTTTNASPAAGQRIDLSRLGWLEDGGSHRLKLFFANRTGQASTLRLETNITTLNLANRRGTPGVD